MSFLTPLYILGTLAIAAPIVFHLIRRSPRGEVPFSSLMFLSPTPPRLTRRSRLDHWLLLLLRATALGLLAFAFARPFLREEALRADPGEGERRRLAVLIDTSASLRRGDLWTRSKALASRAIDEARPGDELAVLAFDRTTRPLLSFAESSTLDPARRAAVARARLDQAEPTWAATDLGQALIDAVAAIEDVSDASETAGRMPRRIVLVSDLQRGSRLEALGGFEWPSDVELELRTVSDDRPNATLQALGGAADAEGDPTLRVRVANEPGSRLERFRLSWGDDAAASAEVYVPPGESRVVRVPGAAPRRPLRLAGDAHGFDNTLYLAADDEGEAIVLYLGDDAADDPSGMFYYLERAFPVASRRAVAVRRHEPGAPIDLGSVRDVPLVVLTRAASGDDLARLREGVRGGRTLLVVLTSPEQAEALAALTGSPPAAIEEARAGGDVMLGEIAFDHPLFAPFAGAQFNDFTKIRFWRYRRIDWEPPAGGRVPARFENGDPALIEVPVGAGRVVVLASGWQPADSQLARSSKFVPLMAGLLAWDGSRASDAAHVYVGDPVRLPGGEGVVVRRPDGRAVAVESGASAFAGTDEPGLYAIETPEGARTFAVNLDPAEGRTGPMEPETLEQLGCRLAGDAPRRADPAALRQLRNAELEGRQKLWRWLVLAAVGVLIVETWLAGRASRSRPVRAEALAS